MVACSIHQSISFPLTLSLCIFYSSSTHTYTTTSTVYLVKGQVLSPLSPGPAQCKERDQNQTHSICVCPSKQQSISILIMCHCGISASLVLFLVSLSRHGITSFAPSSLPLYPLREHTFATNLFLSFNDGNRNEGNRYDEQLSQKAEINARLKSQNTGVGSAAAGAILGGLILGPFGALFGASIGNQIGMSSAVEKARKEEMAKMGITTEMLEQAREIGLLLDRGVEGLKAAEDSLVTQQRFAKKLEEDMERLYKDATIALQGGNESRAKDLLFKRTQIQDKLKKTLMNCVEEKKRLEKMQENVRAIEERALEIEYLMKRSVGAKTLMDTTSTISAGMDTGLSLAPEDPLLKKFRDMGID